MGHSRHERLQRLGRLLLMLLVFLGSYVTVGWFLMRNEMKALFDVTRTKSQDRSQHS